MILKNILSFLKKIYKSIPSKKNKGNSLNRLLSIRTKLISAFMIIIIPIIILGTVSNNIARSSLEEKTFEADLTVINNTAQLINNLTNNIEGISMQLFSDKRLQEYFATDYGDSYEKIVALRTIENALNSILLSDIRISNITIAAKDSKFISTGLYKYGSIDFKELEENSPLIKKVIELNGKVLWVDTHPEIDKHGFTESKEYSLSSMRQIKDLSTAKLLGVEIIDINSKVMGLILSNASTGINGEVILVSDSGINIKSSDFITNESDKKFIFNTPIKESFLWPEMENSQEENGFFISDSEQGKMLVTYSRILSNNFTVIGITPYTEISNSTRQISKVTIIIVITSILFALFIGIYISLSMGKNIGIIMKATEKAALGDLTSVPSAFRRDEIGMMTQSLAVMIKNMRGLIEQALEITSKVDFSAETISDTSQQVAQVSSEISKAISEISSGASAQASDAEQSSIKISELASKINSVSDSAKTINDYSTKTMDMTKNGIVAINDLDNKTKQTNEITKNIVNDINELEEQSKSIGKIIKVITTIADQTNLLALNAAIEAARAGEYGKGFAVVADEVRKLAEQSMKSAREIGIIVQNTRQKTSQAVERAQSTGNIIELQNKAVNETVSIFNNIFSSMELLNKRVSIIMDEITEMEKNKDEAVLSIQNISAVSQQTAASSQEVTASTQEQLSSIEELAAHAYEMRESSKKLSETISQFKVR